MAPPLVFLNAASNRGYPVCRPKLVHAKLPAAGAAQVRPPLVNLLSAPAEETTLKSSVRSAIFIDPASCPPLKQAHGADE